MTQRTAAHRLVLGLASSAVSQALAGTQTIVLVPFFISAWQAEGYGRWLTLSAIASHLTITTLGGQSYIANVLAIHFGREEQSDFRERLSEAVSLSLLIGLGLLALLVLGFLWAAGLLFGLDGPVMTGNDALALLLLGTHAVVLSGPGGVYATVYRSSGQFARGAVISNLGRLVNIAGSIALLTANASLAEMAGWVLVSDAVTTLIIVMDSRRVIPACRGVRVNVTLARAGFKRFALGSLHFCVISVATEVNQQGIVLILAAMASPVAIAIYATHRMFASIPNSVATLAQGPLAPELSFLWARRRHGDLSEVSLLATTTFMTIGAVAAAALWAVAPFAYNAWTSHSLQFHSGLACVLIIQSILASGWQTSAWSLLATNQHHALAWWSLGKAVITIALAWQMAGPFGPTGVALAALAADIACGALVFPARAAARLGVPAVQFYARIGLGLVPLVPIVISATAASHNGLDASDGGRAAAGFLTAALAAGVAWSSVMPMMRSLQLR